MSPRYEYRVVDQSGRDTRANGTGFKDRREARKWKRRLTENIPAFGPYVIQRRSLEWEDVS